MPSISPRSIARNTFAVDGKPTTTLNFMPSSALIAFGQVVRAGSGTGRADHQLVLVEILECLHLHPRAVEGHADRRLGCRRANPGEPCRIEARAPRAGDRPQRRAGRDDRHCAAVPGRDIVDVVGGDEATGARHVLGYHVRLSGQMPADMARHRPAPEVEAAAWSRGDDHGDGLAGKRRLLRACGRDADRRCGNGRGQQQRSHGFRPHRAECNA